MQTNTLKSGFAIDEKGYYGSFGGAYIPEALKEKVDEITAAFRKYSKDPEFLAEMDTLLRDYVGRPSPLYRCDTLSKRYGAEIYLKREDLNHTGAHKINNAIGLALLAKRMGKRRIIAETGAGQHGVATATVCALLGMECTIFMGAIDIERQQPNVQRMRMLGAKVVGVESGSKTLTEAVTEAINYWCAHPDSFYLIGSAVGPAPYPEMVAHFQSVISREMRGQLLEKTGRDYPDAIVACIGGGSNAAGAFYHFIDNPRVRLIGAEAAGMGADTERNAATLTNGSEGVIHGFRTVVLKTPEGEIAEPYSISAGLDYPGIGPLHAHLASSGREEVVAVSDREALDAAMLLTRSEGIIPALESAHAVAALEKISFNPVDVIVVNLSGRGDKDMATYIADMTR